MLNVNVAVVVVTVKSCSWNDFKIKWSKDCLLFYIYFNRHSPFHASLYLYFTFRLLRFLDHLCLTKFSLVWPKPIKRFCPLFLSLFVTDLRTLFISLPLSNRFFSLSLSTFFLTHSFLSPILPKEPAKNGYFSLSLLSVTFSPSFSLSLLSLLLLLHRSESQSWSCKA